MTEEATIAQTDLVTPEARQHGDYKPATIIHVESYTRAMVLINAQTGPMLDLANRGVLTPEQYQAACEIAAVAEAITTPCGIRSASLEARVDNHGSARNLLVERLALIQLEAAYSRWRQRLPVPRTMLLDMIVLGRPIFVTARKYRVGLPKARKRLVNALDDWMVVRDRAVRDIDTREAEAAQFRCGGGVVA